ncbi:ABC transporter ATP-binding protein [Methanocella arvoryzae]|uniref:ABC-type peptide transport system,ATPase component 2 n=1 Tax=Methanocella arvoryzae (strain DSM 22066 / NBRC 105507 / MRE50) TaxID=351160 RepID=Q0W8E9_METAR|nr:putative ABC-type peptide transport system,ATPase component 2 [Methanocella arvoryzae MRE50]
MSEKLIEIKDLKVYFPIQGGIFSRTVENVKAVDGVSFYIKKGETLGLVGESGCGKTTVGRSILMLTPPTSGEVLFEGTDLICCNRADLRKLRQNMQIVFQDPNSSLNPRMLVKDIVAEPLIINGMKKGEELDRKVAQLLETVGLNPTHANRYPHEFSGGQRQRIGIARALALNPKFIVLDEPTSSLDVSVQSQILNKLEELQRDLGLTYLFISHNLIVVKYLSDRVAVMYLGKIVESAKTDDLFAEPMHPYTQALLSAIPVPDPSIKTKRIILEGDVPTPINPPKGCRFHTRCRHRMDICDKVEPEFKDIGGEHFVACHLIDKK